MRKLSLRDLTVYIFITAIVLFLIYVDCKYNPEKNFIPELCTTPAVAYTFISWYILAVPILAAPLLYWSRSSDARFESSIYARVSTARVLMILSGVILWLEVFLFYALADFSEAGGSLNRIYLFLKLFIYLLVPIIYVAAFIITTIEASNGEGEALDWDEKLIVFILSCWIARNFSVMYLLLTRYFGYI